MAQKFQATVKTKEKINSNVYFVTFALQEPTQIEFRAGQCMMLMISPGINRTMSICSVPQENSAVSMIADVSPMGPGSMWTLGLNVGDPATFVAPTGVFFFDETSSRKKIFVATGTGIAPFHAMILEKVSKVSEGSEVSMSLYWGQRYEEDVYWKGELDTIAAEHPEFTWHQVLSKPGPDWKGRIGHVTEHVMSSEKNFIDTDYYLCGNKLMIEDVRSQLIAKNVLKEQIKTELFY